MTSIDRDAPSEMVERVAKEIYEMIPYDEPGKKPAWVEHGNSLTQRVARACAREILKAMKEPTEEMIAEMVVAHIREGRKPIEQRRPNTAAWKAAINAALTNGASK